MNYGVTTEGFVIKDLQTIKVEMETELKATFGQDLDVSESSVTGQLIGNLSKKYADLWEILRAVYNAFSPDSATDVSLDRAAALTFVKRQEATKSEAVVALFGDSGTIVPLGHLVLQTSTNERFLSKEAVTIQLSNLLQFEFSITTLTIGVAYSFTLNLFTISYTSVLGDDENAIIVGLLADLATKVPATTRTNLGGGAARVRTSDGITSMALVFSDVKMTLDVIASPSVYEAETAGAKTVPASTLTVIGTPISGLDSVDNFIDGTAGRDRESDAAFRNRRKNDLYKGYATDDAIRVSVLEEVENVTYVDVVSNREDTIVGGRSPHSFETIVVGGDDTEIAEKIWQVMPAGIQPHGTTTVVIQDSMGRNQTIKFTRPEVVRIWLKLTINRYTEEEFPVNGAELIKEDILTYSQSIQKVGVDVIQQRYMAPIYQTPGVGTVVLTMAARTDDLTPAPGEYNALDKPVSSSQIAQFSTTRMEVTVL